MALYKQSLPPQAKFAEAVISPRTIRTSLRQAARLGLSGYINSIRQLLIEN